MREATHWSYDFVRDVEVGRPRFRIRSVTDPVDFLVALDTMVIPVLPSTSNREHDLRRMPSTDTSDLPQTLVGFARKLFLRNVSADTPSLESLALTFFTPHLFVAIDTHEQP